MIKKQIRRFSFLLIVFLGSCATIELAQFTQNYDDSKKTASHIFEKNYLKGEESQSYVGEPMIRIKDYYLSESSGKRLKVINDTKFSNNIGKLFNICGKTNEGDLMIQIVEVNDRYACILKPLLEDIRPLFGVPIIYAAFGILVDPISMRAKMTWTRYNDSKPNDLRKGTTGASLFTWDMIFEKVVDENIDSSKGYDNFEMIYSGISNNNTIRILYREYSREDLARSNFFQELTYPKDNKTIRFKDISIKVIDAETDKINFTVIEDGRENTSS